LDDSSPGDSFHQETAPVTEADSTDREDPVLELERRQDDVLRALDQLSQRLETVLKQYAEDAAASKYAAACGPRTTGDKGEAPTKCAA
jgi:hypothetical protein